MNFPNINDLIFSDSGMLLFKIPLLILIFLYALFCFIVINRIAALNRIVHIASAHASATLQIVAIVQFFLAVSLFILTIVIV